MAKNTSREEDGFKKGVSWEPGEPWPSRRGPLDGPQGPDKRPWVPEAPKPKTASKARKKGSGNAKGGGKPSKPQDFYPNGALPRA